MDILWVLVVGAVLAIIATVIRRGRSGMPWWGNWLAGMGGAVGGYYIAGALGVAATDGIDWIRWAISIALAVILIGVGSSLFRKGR